MANNTQGSAPATLDRVFRHVVELVQAGKPFATNTAMCGTGLGSSAINRALHILAKSGRIHVQAYQRGSSYWRVITVPGVGQTADPRPKKRDPRPTARMTPYDEILARRLQVEEERKARQRALLEQERAPRERPAYQFMDKATAMALQGVAR